MFVLSNDLGFGLMQYNQLLVCKNMHSWLKLDKFLQFSRGKKPSYLNFSCYYDNLWYFGQISEAGALDKYPWKCLADN